LHRGAAARNCWPDNAVCEGFFGRLKTELFYPRDWQATTIEQFIQIVDAYIYWSAHAAARKAPHGYESFRARRRRFSAAVRSLGEPQWLAHSW